MASTPPAMVLDRPSIAAEAQDSSAPPPPQQQQQMAVSQSDAEMAPAAGQEAAAPAVGAAGGALDGPTTSAVAPSQQQQQQQQQQQPLPPLPLHFETSPPQPPSPPPLQPQHHHQQQQLPPWLPAAPAPGGGVVIAPAPTAPAAAAAPATGAAAAAGDADADIQLSPEQAAVADAVLIDRASVFFTGRAGTGKSTLLRHIIAALRARHGGSFHERVAVTAPTGLAATHVKGVRACTVCARVHAPWMHALWEEEREIGGKTRTNRGCRRRGRRCWKGDLTLTPPLDFRIAQNDIRAGTTLHRAMNIKIINRYKDFGTMWEPESRKRLRRLEVRERGRGWWHCGAVGSCQPRAKALFTRTTPNTATPPPLARLFATQHAT